MVADVEKIPSLSAPRSQPIDTLIAEDGFNKLNISSVIKSTFT